MKAKDTAARSGFSRRRFVQMGAAIAAVAGGAIAPRRAQSAAQTAPPANPKNVIFMVSDGMSPGVLSLVERFARDCLGRRTQWGDLLADPAVVGGFFDTASLSSPVTDSAAASTAWGSGSRVFNGAINILPDGTSLTPLAQVVRSTGRRVGLVTTATVTHATPAGFAAVQAKRDDEKEIAPQYRDVVDIALGGGAKFFPDALIEQYRQSGYAVVRDRSQLLAAGKPAKLLGLFSEEHMPFTVDQVNDSSLATGVPTLADMTRVAIDALVRQDKGFLLQVEGARIDHAAHANDVPALLHDQLAFDDAIRLVMDFARNRDDTLVLITTDHGNSNPGILGMGTEYNASGELLVNLAPMTSSYTGTIAAIRHLAGRRPVTSTQVAEICTSRLRVNLKDAQAAAIANVLNAAKISTPLHPQLHQVVGVFGQVMVNHTGVAWMGTAHSSDYAVVSAFGPGAGRFRGIMQNRQAFSVLTELLGCPFKNPSLTPEEARKFIHAAATGAEDFGWLRTLLA